MFPLSPGGGIRCGQYVYHSFTHLDIEVYTDLKDPELEQKVEAVLSAYELFYHKSEVWIEEEKMYEVLYELTV